MAFGAIEIVSMTRTQEYTTIKHNEDNKPMMDQANFGQQMEKQTNNLAKRVNTGDSAEWHNQNPDAKEKGRNEYAGDGGSRRNREKTERMVTKERGGFDMKV